MTHLTVYADDKPGQPILSTDDRAAIAAVLAKLGVRFECWDSPVVIGPEDAPETILAAYKPYLDGLMGATGAGSADVIKLTPDHPQAAMLRAKFLSEHTHSEDEIRFFVAGGGNFVLHVDGRVFDAYCSAGDLIGVPAGAKHWFDAGVAPSFTALRIFTDVSGWVAEYTGDIIAERFPARPSFAA